MVAAQQGTPNSTEFHGQQSSWGSEWGTQKRGGSSKVPLCNHLVLSVSICWGSAPGALALPLASPAGCRRLFLATAISSLTMLSCLQHTAPNIMSHAGLFPHRHLTSALHPTSSSSVMLRPTLSTFPRLVQNCPSSSWGALGPGGLNLPSLWFTPSCSANTLKRFYVTWFISPVAGCLLEKGPSNCG